MRRARMGLDETVPEVGSRYVGRLFAYARVERRVHPRCADVGSRLPVPDPVQPACSLFRRMLSKRSSK